LVRGVNWLGDAVISLPGLHAIIHGQPPGSIEVLARASGAELYRQLPNLGAVIEDYRGLCNKLKLIKKLSQKSYQKAVLFQNAFGAALTSTLSGIKDRVGFSRHYRRLLLTTPLKPLPADLRSHELFYYLKIVKAAGFNPSFSLPRLTAPQIPNLSDTMDPAQDKIVLALVPGASNGHGLARQWGPANFAQAAKEILSGNQGEVLILGSKGEIEACNETEKLLEGGPPVKNLAGKTSLAELIATLSETTLVLANDSGIAHLAGALGIKLVVLFGSTNPLTTGPLAKNACVLRKPSPCAPCFKRECPLKKRICFDGLTPQLAAEAAWSLLHPKKDRTPDLRGAVFLGNIPEDLKVPSGPLQLILLLKGTELNSPLLEPPLAKPRGFTLGVEPKPVASYKGFPVYDGTSPQIYSELAEAQKLSLMRSFWLASDLSFLKTAQEYGGKSCLYFQSGMKVPSREAILQENFTPKLVAPTVQGALDWAEYFRDF
jgi:heptosyltransferase-2